MRGTGAERGGAQVWGTGAGQSTGAGSRCAAQVRSGEERRCGTQVRGAGAGPGRAQGRSGPQVRGAGMGRRCGAQVHRCGAQVWGAAAERGGVQVRGAAGRRCEAQVHGGEECEWGPLAARAATLSGGMGGISRPDALPGPSCPVSCALFLFSLLGLSWPRSSCKPASPVSQVVSPPPRILRGRSSPGRCEGIRVRGAGSAGHLPTCDAMRCALGKVT